MKDEVEITLKDLEAAVFALAGWLDAFSDEDEWKEDAERIRRVKARMEAVLASAAATPGRQLRLVKPEDVN